MEGLVLLADTDDTAGKDTVGQIEAPMRLAVLAMLAAVLVLLAGLVIQTVDTDIPDIEDTVDILDIEDTVDILGIEDTVDILGIEDTVDIPDTEDIHEEYQE